MLSFSHFTRSSKARWAALLLACVAPALTFAQREEAPRKEISEKVSEQLAKLRELTDNKQFDAALTLINELMRGAQANSYDIAVLAQIKAQVLLTQNNYGGAIAPLEQALQLGETYGYFDAKQLQDLMYYLAQLYYQEATALKDPAQQKPGLEKSLTYMRRYLKSAAAVTTDAHQFAAYLFYNAATLDQENPDKGLLQEAKQAAEQGLYSAIKPREPFYVIILAILQQEGRNEEAAELLELLVKQFPTNRQYWQQLAFTYLALAEAESEKGNTERAYEWNVRTILTIERAQKLGIMDTPKDHFNLIGIYFNIQRFDQAVELLEQGLNNGNVENTQRNWELLAQSYQQVRKEMKAIDVLKEAAKRFPEAGQIDYTIASIYYQLDKLEDAYKHAEAALKKGNLDNRSGALLFAAYIGYELRRYEDALKLAQEAAKDEKAEKADGLLRAIEAAIAEREQALKAKVF